MGNKKIYFENLDGFRAIAAFSVIFFHSCIWLPSSSNPILNTFKNIISFNGQGGFYGVEFFFILSGFLITFLLLNEQQEYGKINFPYFYLRRILRIWPLYYLTLIIGFFVYPFLKYLIYNETYYENASLLLYSTFLTNFDHIYNKNPSIGILGVQWSVAVEEQFYLIWPLIIYIGNKLKMIPVFFIILFIFSDFYFLVHTSWVVKYYHFFSCIRFLSTGGILAYICFNYQIVVEKYLNKIPKIITIIIYILFLLILYYYGYLSNIYFPYKDLLHFAPIIFFGFVIIEQIYSSRSFFKIGNIKILTWLGKISYGLYLTHMIAVYLILSLVPLKNTNLFILNFLLVSIITVIISYLSYTFFETYFLKLKRKFSKIITF